jgi:hypothetical protein
MLRLRGRAGIAGGLVTALLATIAASAGAHSFDQPDRVLVSTSGSNSEKVSSVPIGQAPGQSETVVMSLSPKGQPFQSGDGLNPSSELEVTTDCSVQLDSCVGTPYAYDPMVDTQLILTPSNDPFGGGGTAVPMAQETGRTCTHEQHHCTIVFPFPASPFTVWPPACANPTTCNLNLVLSAYTSDPGWQSGQVLVVGEDEPGCCGITVQDKGRVNAVRLRPVVSGKEPSGQVTTYSSGRLVSTVPVCDTPSQCKTVVLSQRLDRMRRNEQLAVSADMTSDISSLRYNRVLIKSQLILADRQGATERSAEVKQLEEQKGEIDESNGFNCTQDTTPCQTRKVGVAHLVQSADSRLFVNLVVSSTPAKSGQAQPGEVVTVAPDAALKVVRYPASRYG